MVERVNHDSQAQTLVVTPMATVDGIDAWQHKGKTDILTVVISGVGGDVANPPSYEFPRVASGNGTRTVLFISDPNRTWLNGVGLIEKIVELIEHVKSEYKFNSVILMGHSMGGFVSLVLPKFTPVKRVLAFAPQFSIDPSIVPDELRWQEFRAEIPEITIRSANDYLVSECEYTVIHGLNRKEAPQREGLVARPNIRHFLMPNTSHNVPKNLKKNGVLADVVDNWYLGKNRRVRKIIKSLGGYTRTPPIMET